MGRKRSPHWTQVHDLTVDMDYFHRHQHPGPGDCISWSAGKHKQGYGMMGAFREDGTKIMTTVHRVVARIKYDEPLPSSQMVIHNCGNLNCCNPDHIEKGDRAGIIDYRRKHGRFTSGWKKVRLKHPRK